MVLCLPVLGMLYFVLFQRVEDYCLSANYRSLALASWFSKLIELYILELWGDLLISSQLQFGFKSGLTTSMCTGVLRTVVSH